MTITFENRDLFDMPQGYYLAHCISADFTLGAGVAKAFDSVYNMRFKLFRHHPDYEYHGGDALLIDNVFNLVTKDNRYAHPTYESIRDALEMAKEYMAFLDVDKLAMPKIGSGRDRLDWSVVYNIICEVFDDMDIEIVICAI